MKTNNRGLAGFAAGLALFASSPFGARAALSYENINGVGLIYDSVTDITWTQDGDVSGQTFDFQDAQTWAANLDVAGIGAGNWQLPNDAQFTSLYGDLPGVDHRYGAEVSFGAGPNDFAINVEPEYWTDTDSTDFNFYYGYAGGRTDDQLYPAWAVTTATVPEPSTLAYGLAAGLAVGRRWLRRK